MQITKSVNGGWEDKKKKEDAQDEDEVSTKKDRDTMGLKHYVPFGLYKICGSINVQLAEKTGFTEEDAEIVKECLKTLFENDASSARPDGSMEVAAMYWWKHNSKLGQYNSAIVHRSVSATKKEGVIVPMSFDDYDVTVKTLEGLEAEKII